MDAADLLIEAGKDNSLTNGPRGATASSTDDDNLSNGSVDGTNSSVNQNPMSYQNDLWDCITILGDNTWVRLGFIANLRKFVLNYKKALEVFTRDVQKANNQLEKDFLKSAYAEGMSWSQQPHLVDTLTGTMAKIKQAIDSLTKNLSARVESVEKDIAEPLDVYHRHYKTVSHDNMRDGTVFWNSIHAERTQMLFAKENYFNQVQNLQSILQQYYNQQQATGGWGVTPGGDSKPLESMEESPFLTILLSQDKKFWQQYTRMENAKSEYEKSLALLNMRIDLRFEADYLPVLQRLQDSDDGMIQFARHSLDKFARYLDLAGKDLSHCGSVEVAGAVDQINPETDLKAFIANNRTGNPVIRREEFQVPPDVVVNGKVLKLDTLASLKATLDSSKPQSAGRKTSDNEDSAASKKQAGPSRVERALKAAWGAGSVVESELSAVEEAAAAEQRDIAEQKAQVELLQQRLILRDQLHMILRGSQSVGQEEKRSILDQLESNRAFRETLCEVLNDLGSGRHLENQDCLQVIADLIRHSLTCYLKEQQFVDSKFFYTVLECSANLYCLGAHNRKHYLWALLADHHVWLHNTQWRECTIDIVSMRIDEAKRRQLLRLQQAAQPAPVETPPVEEANPFLPQETQAPQGKAGAFFKKGLTSLKTLLSSNKDKEKSLALAKAQQQEQLNQQNVELKYQQNLVFNELSRFVTHFINFGLPYGEANDLLISVCDHFQLEQSRMHLLLTELISNQKRTSTMFTDKEQLIWSLERRSNRLKQFGFSDTLQIVGMTIKFVDDDATLAKLLLLGKDFYDTLRKPVYKQALLRSSQARLKEKRTLLWIRILDIPHHGDAERLISEEYERHRRLSESPEHLSKHVSDAIEVDVTRSFNHLKEVSASNLNNILKAYATVNKESLDYCQGMNFIAGFLFMVFSKFETVAGSAGNQAITIATEPREDLAFAVMKEVINRFRMHELFNQQLPMLKLNFYQLDRLIAILLPDLHTHFKEEAINSSYFSAPYFITLFTSTLQMQTHMLNCEQLLRLWDYFIVNGWKAIFKISLALLKEFEEQMLEMSFEVLLTQIVNLPGRYFLKDYPDRETERQAIARFDQQVKDIKLPTMLLERLKKEFDENFEVSRKRTSSVTAEDMTQLPPPKQSVLKSLLQGVVNKANANPKKDTQ